MEAEGQSSAMDAGIQADAAAAAANRAPDPQPQQAARDEAYMRETPLHTIFVPKETPLSDRRWWVLHGLKPRGRIIIDEGAYRAIARSSTHASAGSRYPAASQPSPIVPLLVQATAAIAGAGAAGPSTSASATIDTTKDRSPSHSSGSTGNGGRLLPAGVIAVEGTFAAGQAVTVVVQKKRRGGRNAAERAPRQERRERKDSATAGAGTGSSTAAVALPPSMSSSIISETGHSLDTPEQSRPPSPSPTMQRSRSQRQRGDYHSTTEDQDDDDEAEGEADEQIEFGRGLANYNSQEIDKIKGHKR
jgi:glutamate 5-kinase